MAEYDLHKLKADLKELENKTMDQTTSLESKAILDKIKCSKKLNSEFNRISQKIQLTNASKCNSVFQETLPQVIEKMRATDSLFNSLYKCNVYTGSYYDKLRIKDACEFDINLVLRLPARSEFVKVKPAPSPHALLQFNKPAESLGLTEKEVVHLKNLFDSEGYALPGKVLAWIQGIMDRAVLKDIQVEGVKKIHFTASGPAKTLLIVLNDPKSTTISVDLVPVFRFCYEEWPQQLRKLRENFVQRANNEKKYLYLVPKCYKPGLKQSPNEPAKKNWDRIWRMHFADMEQSVLQEHPHSRPIIKLLKLLRDSQKWSNLHSYFLKTLVLNEIARNPNKQWKPELLVVNLLEMMDLLKKCFVKGKLPHFFFQSVNLFQYMSNKEIKNMNARLSIIRKDITSNPDRVKAYFLV